MVDPVLEIVAERLLRTRLRVCPRARTIEKRNEINEKTGAAPRSR